MQAKKYLMAEGIQGSVTLDYMTDVNFAMAQNLQSALVGCTISNDSDTAWHDLTFSISGEVVKEHHLHIDSIAAATSIDITKDIDIMPDPDEMIRLTEPRLTTFAVALKMGETTIFSQQFPLRLMAYDQWLGIGMHPEMLAAFVMPNHPIISRVLANASKFMERWTGSGSLDEYQSGDPHRVRQQVAAIYEALRSEGLIYVTPKASFESQGQRIRTADKVLNEKLGTCLDLTVLMASCLECIGIHPLIVLTKGHAFLGAWLVPTMGAMVGDDASYLLKSAAQGIGDMVFVETTMLTQSGNIDFEEASRVALSHLKDEGGLQCYIDIAECRYSGVRPITMIMQNGDQWVVVNDTASRQHATTDVKRVDRYDLSVYDGEGASVTKYTIWERKLLDFSLRNNLLNMKLGRKIIPIVSFNIDKLEDELQAGRSYRVLPFPIQDAAKPTGGIFDSSQFPQLEEPISKQLSAGTIYSFHNEEELTSALKYAFRSSRTSLEENGANNLYLVLGVLKWFETERVQRPLYAPLLLLPIEIIRGSRGSGYTIRTRDEEISLNVTLTEMLKQQQDVDLSVLNTLPTDQSGVDVKKILAIVRDKIRNKRGWNVIDEAVIGLFSFNKFVMWNDIHANSDLLHANPIISSLVDGKLNFSVSESMTDAKEADKLMHPGDFAIPIDVDSSQLEAVIDSGAGRSFILHGPPGTGKSQTITNMIANALYQGKRVLFVAEKMAALSVVQSRLEKVGLAPFCLELHSNKVTKQHFLRQMEMALDVVHGTPARDYKAEAETLLEKRKQLMDYIEALHQKRFGGLSLYDAITGYLAIDGEELKIDANDHADISLQKIEEMKASLERLDTIFRAIGKPSESAFAGLNLRDGSAEAETRLRKELAELEQLLLSLKSPELINLIFDPAALSAISEAVDAKLDIAQMRRDVLERYGQNLASADLGMLRRQWEQVNAKWFLPRWLGRRSLLKQYAITVPDMDYLIDIDSRMRQCQATAYDHEQNLNRLFGQDMAAGRRQLDICGKAVDNLQRINASADIEVPADQLLDALRRWNTANHDMRNWYLWCKEKSGLKQARLQAAIDHILLKGETGKATSQAFAKGMHHAVANKIINSTQQLRFFNGIMFDEVIQTYRQLTAQFQDLSKKELYCRLAAKIPSMSMEAFGGAEIGILKRNIKNGGRGTSIRRLIDQIPTLLPKLCPCMLMSPLSVAQYIDLNNDKFDIVVFDEASQMPTSEAVGAIARGKALIVVGDPMQMPPTSFFATSAVGEEEADIDDMESILDDCLALSIPSKYLSWHYRSKHESLIAFSNSQYYGGKLHTFPSVDDRERKVSLRAIEGVYQRSGARVNLPEAKAVVDEVLRRLADPELTKRSIGIVSFSKVQQDKIEDLLTEELAKHPDLETKAYECEEPVFIKNLENVQGDERDVILFSVGYGPDKDGKVSMNFGPLNKVGGERRLNVAVSRARYEMIVFSSMRAEHIDMRRTSALGVEGLKKFLEFAENGNTSILADNQVNAANSCIAGAIAEELRSHGYDVCLGVGRSQFKIDVAVVDPRDPGKYMLGIMLDGPAYFATKTVRDREIVQPSVLKMLKWNIARVWTIDWYERRDSVIEALLQLARDIEQGQAKEQARPAPKSSAVKDIAQDIVPADSANIAAGPRPYVTAKGLSQQMLGSVDELANHQRLIKRQILTIVETEQPIASSLLYKRIVKLWGLSRVSPRVMQLVDQLLCESPIFSTINGDKGLVWWTSRQAYQDFEGFRTDSEREIADVPFIEIQNAMRYVIDQQIALSRDDLKRLVANQLGFTRKGNAIDAITDLAVEDLAAEGYIVATNDNVSRAS